MFRPYQHVFKAYEKCWSQSQCIRMIYSIREGCNLRILEQGCWKTMSDHCVYLR